MNNTNTKEAAVKRGETDTEKKACKCEMNSNRVWEFVHVVAFGGTRIQDGTKQCFYHQTLMAHCTLLLQVDC